MGEKTAKLIDDRSATVALLTEPLSWRVRVVEEIVVDSATSCIRRRSLQVAPLRGILGARVGRRHTHAMLALNLAAVPRGPLVEFDVRGPLGDAWLLPRTEIATRQQLFLTRTAELCGLAVEPALRSLLTSLLGFTGEWFSSGVPDDLVSDYIEPGLGWKVAAASRRAWLDVGARARAVLRPRLDEFRQYSACENPMLVIPELFESGVVTSEREATTLLQHYCTLLERLDAQTQRRDEPVLADEFLTALADYANSYDLIAAMRVPLDEPFMVKFSERRDLRLTARNESRQDLVIADAQTNHVTLRIADPNIRIASFTARRPADGEYAYGAFQSRQDQQSRAFYAHDADRDYRIRLVFRLALLRRLAIVPAVVTVLLLAIAGALWVSRPTTLETLALVVGPSALAASVLLYREPSTLGSRLRRVSSGFLTASLGIVLISATFLYLLGGNVLGLI